MVFGQAAPTACNRNRQLLVLFMATDLTASRRLFSDHVIGGLHDCGLTPIAAMHIHFSRVYQRRISGIAGR